MSFWHHRRQHHPGFAIQPARRVDFMGVGMADFRHADDSATDATRSQQDELDQRLRVIRFISGAAVLAVLTLLTLCTVAPAGNLARIGNGAPALLTPCRAISATFGLTEAVSRLEFTRCRGTPPRR